MQPPRPHSGLHGRFLVFLLCAACCAFSVAAQEEDALKEAPPRLTVEEAGDLIGSWVIRLTSPQGEFDADLKFKGEQGFAVASLDLGPLGDHEVEMIRKTETGVELNFEAALGGQTFEIAMPVDWVGEDLKGSISDSNGLFDMQFVGIRESKAQELERSGERTRIRVGGGGGRGQGDTSTTQLAFGGKKVSIRFDRAKQSELAYERLSSIADGEVITFELHQSTKFRTELDLRFGDALIIKENVAESYPGVYSLWLQKTGDGWNLLFNDKADVWGTQHDSSADRAAVPLEFSADADEPAETLTVEMSESGDGGTLRIAWGPYEWSTAFTVAN